MDAKPGTYALILRSRASTGIEVGRWGRLTIEPGYYIYVGSAFGPGGVRARVTRHCRRDKAKHWHIDYLREFVTPVCAWYSYRPEHREHHWAQAFSAMTETSVVEGFGCSDCTCPSHLFRRTRMPDLRRFASAVGEQVRAWRYRSGR